MMNIDTTLFLFLNSFAGRSEVTDSIIIFLAEYLPIILSIILAAYILSRKYPLRERTLLILSAFAAALLSRYGAGSPIRYLWHRDRPFLTYHAHQLLIEHSYSFPSGHATFFFGLSTILFLYHRRIGIFFYAASTIMVIARVMAGVHYPSDVLAGAVIGTVFGFLICRYINPLLGISKPDTAYYGK